MFTGFFKTSFWLLSLCLAVSLSSHQGKHAVVCSFSTDPPGCLRCAEGLSGEPVQNRSLSGPTRELPGAGTQESALRRLCSRSCYRWSLGPAVPQTPFNLDLPSHTCSTTAASPPTDSSLPWGPPQAAPSSGLLFPPSMSTSQPSQRWPIQHWAPLSLAETNGVHSPPWEWGAGADPQAGRALPWR